MENETLVNYPQAVCKISGGKSCPELCGEVHFCQKADGVLVTVGVTGLPISKTGFFGFHIHEGGACSGDDFADTKMHYDKGNRPHPLHSGDLPPLLSCSGKAYMSVLSNRFTLRDIIGRTVVIHSEPDDFTTQPAGNAGKKIACGVIRKL